VLESCGNGDLDDGEECDDGTDDGGVGEDGDDNDSCLETCQWNSCGDGFRYMAVTEGGAGQNTARIEACDDGNGIDTDSCISSCEWADCTDGNPYIDVTVPARNDEGWEDAMEDAVAACPEGYQESAICDVDEDHPGDDGPCDDGGYTMDECSPPNGPEQCDDGNGTESDSCLSSCEFNDCLDGEVYTTLTDPQNLNPLEQCDDGIASADCTASCTPTRCGDGIISEEAGETCDPEHPDFEENPDDCRADCVLESCGNEVVDDREDCDDGNDDNNDACPNNCIAPRCGDGIVQASLGEDCDDGNTDPTDACTNACLDADCGDGIRQAGVEECDYGVPVGSENGAPNDDGFVDTDGFCTDQCVVQCFQNPAIAWADEYQGNCVFVPEQNWASNDLDYQDISMCGCEDGTPLADVPDVNGDCFCPDGPDEGTAPDPGFLLPDFSSFLSAASYCENLGLDAHLVKIDSQAKNELVMDLINAATAAEVFDPLLGDIGYEDFLETLVNPYWIGLADEHTTQADPEGLWTWYPDATDEVDNSLTNLWLSGQPDDADDDVATPGQEDCGAMYGLDDEGDDDSGGWADHSCGAAFRFVCEFPLDQSP
jgi:cysteine-rich repeat protein